MAGINVNIQLQGFEEVLNKLKNSPQVLEEASKQMLTKATFIARGTAQEASPIDKGTLRGSITSKVEGSGKEMSGVVSSNISYAKYQEFGTRGHGPVRARVLAWQGRNGKWIIARYVRGVTAKKFLQKGLMEVKNNINSIQSLGLSVIKAKLGM